MKTIRVCIPSGDGSFSILEIPERSVVMSLVNDSKRTPYDSVKTFIVDNAWANGDGVELTARRVPVLTCDACGVSLQGIRPGPDSPGGRFVLYDRTCIASVLGVEPCHVGRKGAVAELEEKGLKAAIAAQERSKAATRKILEELDAEDQGLKAALQEIKRELCEAHAMLGGTDQETLKQAVERVILRPLLRDRAHKSEVLAFWAKVWKIDDVSRLSYINERGGEIWLDGKPEILDLHGED